MIRAALLATALSLATPAWADASAPDAALLDKAHQMMLAMHAQQQMHAMIDAQLAQMTKGASAQALAAMPQMKGVTDDPEFKAIFDRYIAQVSGDMRTTMTAMIPDLVRQMEAIYAGNFTAHEMDDVIAFYQSPTGQSFVDKMPKVTGEYMGVMQSMVMPAVFKSIKPASDSYIAEIKAWAAKHPELKGRSQ